MRNNDFWPWLQRLAGIASGVIGFMTTVVSFTLLAQGNASVVIWLSLALGVLLVWLACFHFARFWQPEKQDRTSVGIQPSPTSEQEAAHARKAKQRRTVRWLARAGLWVIPLLLLAGYFGWEHVQSLPSKTVTILVADFEGPDPQNYRITETILTKLRESTAEYSDVKVIALKETITEQSGSELAIDEGEKRKAAIVIWGWYGKTTDTGLVSVNFEVLQRPESLPEFTETTNGAVQTFAVAELESFQLQTRLSSEMTYLTLFTLGVSRYAAEDWENALTRFAAALQSLETDTERTDSESLYASITHFYRGIVFHQLKHYEDAIAAYDAALQLQPNFPFSLQGKGDALYELARYEEAITAYDAALSLQPDSVILSNRGNALSNVGLYGEALESLNAALKLQPDSSDALNNKGNVLFRLGRYEEALATYDVALKLQPNSPIVLYNKGTNLNNLFRYEEALESLNAALKLQPDFSEEVLSNKGSSLAGLERYEEAIAAYDAALELEPEKPRTHYNKGIALAALGRYEEAIAAYDTTLKIEPSFPAALQNKGTVLARLGRYEEAITAYDAALQLQPNIYIALNNKGEALSKLERYEEAIIAYDDALRLQPNYLKALDNKAHALRALKRYEEAILTYDAALKIQPDFPLALNNKGDALYHLERYEEAVAASDEALRLQPNEAEIYFDLARYHALLDNTETSLRNIKRFLELDLEGGQEAIRKSSDFDNLRDNSGFRELMMRN
ncbi:MAG: tetratricopeptide repeat protein [Phormidesmis sp.]